MHERKVGRRAGKRGEEWRRAGVKGSTRHYTERMSLFRCTMRRLCQTPSIVSRIGEMHTFVAEIIASPPADLPG